MRTEWLWGITTKPSSSELGLHLRLLWLLHLVEGVGVLPHRWIEGLLWWLLGAKSGCRLWDLETGLLEPGLLHARLLRILLHWQIRLCHCLLVVLD